MGTNYYLELDRCECCNRSDRLHIGKESMGWAFALRIYPGRGINSIDDWKPLLKAGVISSERGDEVLSYTDMLKTITDRGKVQHSQYAHRQGLGTWDYFDREFC